MSPTAKFHSIISTFTIGTVYWMLLHVSKLLPPIDTLTPWKKAIVAYITSAAVYSMAAFGLRWLLDRWRLSRQWFLGASYVEGTWVGCYKNQAGEKRLTIEHFEQTLDGLNIKGAAFTETNSDQLIYWTSKAASVDDAFGALTYSYICKYLTYPPKEFEGIANFSFTRANTKTPPSQLTGYSADLIDGVFSSNTEVLLTRKIQPFNDAWKDAKKRNLF